MTDGADDLDRLRRELAYYQRECNELGARLSRASEEQAATFRESHRRRTVIRLMREIYRLWDRNTGSNSFNLETLAIICENALFDRAILLRISDASSGTFTMLAATGFSSTRPPETLDLPRPPAFYYTTGSTDRAETVALTLRACIGVPYLMWAFDKPSGYAMLVGNRYEVNTSRPFDEGDREIIESALTVYLDALVRKIKSATPTVHAQMLPIENGRFTDAGLLEAEIQDNIREGGTIIRLIVVERSGGAGSEYAPYFSTSWRPEFRILRTTRGPDRTYRDFSRLLQFARECGYRGSVAVYGAGAEELRQIPGIRPVDLEPRNAPRTISGAKQTA